ncbi:putative ABC transporter permease [Clostridium sp.]|uniref:putative ABC transporter permease n=1 Tax=Clostridium sp. TaxID=1506 RepID=UPI0028511B71|nr:putative ABC transporter permease [Clostridium sp.]MDR3593486.1 putative ABC transporter permease [Clostridium sp.]
MDIKSYILFNFIIYSFIGWIIEEIYSFIVTGKLKKEGFLIGPFKPMYGIAFTSLIICNEMLGIDGISLMLLCLLIPTTVEYISGYMLRHIFHKNYWDYSDYKYNLYGYVTISFSFCWMILSFIGIYLFQPALYNIYKLEEEFLIIITCIFSVIATLDLVLTLRHFKGRILARKQV